MFHMKHRLFLLKLSVYDLILKNMKLEEYMTILTISIVLYAIFETKNGKTII